jgi:hypothetical protein
MMCFEDVLIIAKALKLTFTTAQNQLPLQLKKRGWLLGLIHLRRARQ